MITRIFKTAGLGVAGIMGLLFILFLLGVLFGPYRRPVIIENQTSQFLTTVLRGTGEKCDYYRSDPDSGICYLLKAGESEELTLKPGPYSWKIMGKEGQKGAINKDFFVHGKEIVQVRVVDLFNSSKDDLIFDLSSEGDSKIIKTGSLSLVKIDGIKKSNPKQSLKIIVKENSQGFLVIFFEGNLK